MSGNIVINEEDKPHKNNENEEDREEITKNFIYKAIDKGWAVKKKGYNKYEFTIPLNNSNVSDNDKIQLDTRRAISNPQKKYTKF